MDLGFRVVGGGLPVAWHMGLPQIGAQERPQRITSLLVGNILQGIAIGVIKGNARTRGFDYGSYDIACSFYLHGTNCA